MQPIFSGFGRQHSADSPFLTANGTSVLDVLGFPFWHNGRRPVRTSAPRPGASDVRYSRRGYDIYVVGLCAKPVFYGCQAVFYGFWRSAVGLAQRHSGTIGPEAGTDGRRAPIVRPPCFMPCTSLKATLALFYCPFMTLYGPQGLISGVLMVGWRVTAVGRRAVLNGC